MWSERALVPDILLKSNFMSTENPNYNVGGTAKDGGLSTADTVADGDVDGGNQPSDGTYQPNTSGKAAPKETRSKTYVRRQMIKKRKKLD